MAEFPKAFDFVLSNEDYSQSDPRFGKVNVDNNNARVRFGLNEQYDKDLPETFFTTMPVAEALAAAKQFMESHYWVEICGNAFSSQAVATKVLDMAVNQGIREASVLLQRVVYDIPFGMHTKDIDGKIGHHTLLKANALPELDTVNGLVAQWMWFIEQEIKNKPEDQKYEADWKARAQKIPPN